MDRRVFLKISGGLLLLSACDTKSGQQTVKEFPIRIDSNASIGHLVRSAIELPISSTVETETLVVGAGIAGLAAACSLPSNDFVVCELDPTLGGTSGAVTINGQLYSQGAHYDLAYPSNYGEDGLDLLEKLNVIGFNNTKRLWEFKEKQFVIPEAKEEACYYNGAIRESVLMDSELKQNFLALLREYDHQFPLPSTLIDTRLHHLDKLTFYDYLQKYLPLTSNFVEALDYQMLDDWGGTTRQVSALAGIHYYKCRPYYDTSTNVELFSPPQGNYYFIEKMARQIGDDKIHKNHLVFKLNRKDNKWYADVLDTKTNMRKKYVSKNVIYAGQKHALRFIHSKSYPKFSDVHYAPWVVINIEMNDIQLKSSKWQNDFLSSDNTFLGFVDSKAQNTKKRILTAYYCFPDIHHYLVKDFENSAKQLVYDTVSKMSTYYKVDISKCVKQAFVKLLGHAMPIPKPGYLTKERKLFKDNLSFAGVDSGRLPLMFDALDSGIQVAKELDKRIIRVNSYANI